MLRQTRGPVTILLVLVAVVTAFTFVLPSPRWFTFAVGVLDASVLWMAALVVIEQSGSWSWRLGSTGEELTGEQLAKLGDRCRVVHALPLKYGDVDHVVVTPAGVVAIESKFTSNPWTTRDVKAGGRLTLAAAQARASASETRLRLRAYAKPLPVEPLVVLWGRTDLETELDVGGTAVVHGSRLTDWLGHRDEPGLSRAEIDAAADGLERYIAGRADEGPERFERFIEVGAYGLALDAGAALSGAVAALLAVGTLLSLPLPFGAKLIAAVVVSALGLTGRRTGWPRVEVIGTGWFVGGALTTAAALIAVAAFWLLG